MRLKYEPSSEPLHISELRTVPQVHFDERLVNLVRDARQFRALGCKIPKEVQL